MALGHVIIIMSMIPYQHMIHMLSMWPIRRGSARIGSADIIVIVMYTRRMRLLRHDLLMPMMISSIMQLVAEPGETIGNQERPFRHDLATAQAK